MSADPKTWPIRRDHAEWCPECGDQCYLICDSWTLPGESLYFYECKTYNRVGGPCEYQSPRFDKWPPETWPPVDIAEPIATTPNS